MALSLSLPAAAALRTARALRMVADMPASASWIVLFAIPAIKLLGGHWSERRRSAAAYRII